VRVVRVARQAAAPLDQVVAARQHGDAVEPFLPVPDRAVPGLAECGLREGLIRGLQLLQAGVVGRGLGEPFEQARQPRGDSVDVEGGDFHGCARQGDSG
jgi:hypothetical protein